nr:coiled-coil domain-containing protein 167 isoform X2 [Saimiri boliviensis boliviensis]
MPASNMTKKKRENLGVALEMFDHLAPHVWTVWKPGFPHGVSVTLGYTCGADRWAREEAVPVSERPRGRELQAPQRGSEPRGQRRN